MDRSCAFGAFRFVTVEEIFADALHPVAEVRAGQLRCCDCADTAFVAGGALVEEFASCACDCGPRLCEARAQASLPRPFPERLLHRLFESLWRYVPGLFVCHLRRRLCPLLRIESTR